MIAKHLKCNTNAVPVWDIWTSWSSSESPLAKVEPLLLRWNRFEDGGPMLPSLSWSVESMGWIRGPRWTSWEMKIVGFRLCTVPPASLYCTVIYCTGLLCNVLYSTQQSCTLLYRTVEYCKHYTVLYSSLLYFTVQGYFVLYITVLEENLL